MAQQRRQATQAVQALPRVVAACHDDEVRPRQREVGGIDNVRAAIALAGLATIGAELLTVLMLKPVGQALTSPLVVRATTDKNQPVANQPIEFTIISGGGSLTTRFDTTDQSGLAQTFWTLGTQVAGQRAARTACGFRSRSRDCQRAWRRSCRADETCQADTDQPLTVTCEGSGCLVSGSWADLELICPECGRVTTDKDAPGCQTCR